MRFAKLAGVAAIALGAGLVSGCEVTQTYDAVCVGPSTGCRASRTTPSTRTAPRSRRSRSSPRRA